MENILNPALNTQPTTLTPLAYDSEKVEYRQRGDIQKDITRWVFSITNDLTDAEKYQFRQVGGDVGGVYFGSSDTNGVPTMKRTRHFVPRGLFVPLETRPIPAKADMEAYLKKSDNVLVVDGEEQATKMYQTFAGHDLNFITGDVHRNLGVVEITALRGVAFDTGVAQKLNQFFFPNLNKWLARTEPMPETIREWEALIKDAISRAVADGNAVYADTGFEMLESVRIFRDYASAFVQKNRTLVEMPAVAGFSFTWSERTKAYAKQLEVELEPENNLRNITNAQTAATIQNNEAILTLVKTMGEQQMQAQARNDERQARNDERFEKLIEKFVTVKTGEKEPANKK